MCCSGVSVSLPVCEVWEGRPGERSEETPGGGGGTSSASHEGCDPPPDGQRETEGLQSRWVLFHCYETHSQVTSAWLNSCMYHSGPDH